MLSDSSVPLLSAEKITKTFPGVKALRGVSLHVQHGETVAVIGENGAGKSTLMKILAGIQPADTGHIQWQGDLVRFQNTRQALSAGIALIHQELNLATNLSLAENIFLGREKSIFGFVNAGTIHARCAKLLKRVGLNVAPSDTVGRLSIGQQQMVEIAKALSVNAKLLIMDEPTSSLSAGETERLFGLIDSLRAEGVSIMYISHRLGEVKRLATRVVVLRDGENAGTLSGHEIQQNTMIKYMVGRELSQVFPHRSRNFGNVRLRANQVCVDSAPRHFVNFNVRAGEIVGLAGLVGAGRTELLQAIMGLRRTLHGEIYVDENQIHRNRIQDSLDAGLCMVPEDRRVQGLATPMTVEQNLTICSHQFRSRLGLRNAAADRRVANESIRELQIKTPSLNQTVAYLSGGNQQKVAIGKWLLRRPKILLLDEPTRGVDVGAREEIYLLMEKLTDEGVAILFASSEMEEVLGMSDRILVMHEGQIQGQLTGGYMTEENVMHLAVGNSLSLETGKQTEC